jgi:hypothetical protein
LSAGVVAVRVPLPLPRPSATLLSPQRPARGVATTAAPADAAQRSTLTSAAAEGYSGTALGRATAAAAAAAHHSISVEPPEAGGDFASLGVTASPIHCDHAAAVRDNSDDSGDWLDMRD